MQYYTIRPAVATKETGSEFPQVQKMSNGYNYDSPHSIYELGKCYNSFPNFKPDLNSFLLHSSAKFTDLFSSIMPPRGFIISPKMKDLLEKFNLPPHNFYPATMMHKDTLMSCYWIHIICDMTRLVDYPKSTFFIYRNYSSNQGYISIDSFEDLLKKEKEIQSNNPGLTITLWAEKIAILPSFDKGLDLFKIGNFSNNHYISDPLRRQIEAHKITGCNINPTSDLIFYP